MERVSFASRIKTFSRSSLLLALVGFGWTGFNENNVGQGLDKNHRSKFSADGYFS
jgi:hypothetical protein